LTEEDVARLVAVMKSYERKSKLFHYDMWGKATSSYKFKVEEFKLVDAECPKPHGPDTLALDAGCGYGVYSLMLSQRGYSVVALDVSAGMLKKAKNSVGEGNVLFVRGSITHLPLREDLFDLTLCLDTLHHFTDSFLVKTLDEFRRTIRHGGFLMIDVRNALNPAISLQYWITNRKWAEKGGLTLEARSLRNMRKKMSLHQFKITKTNGMRFALNALAPYILIVSKAV